MASGQLIKKYNIPGPRYTSYPTVPYWDNEPPMADQWREVVKDTFSINNKDGISLYIHLPYCESLCTYCGCNTRITVNHSVEMPYIVAVLKEWAMYLELFEETPRIKEIHLGGGTPTFFSPTHLKELVEGITSTALVMPDAEFSFEAHPANTTAEHLEILRTVGFTRISVGVQDFDPRVQTIINRRQTFDDVQRVTVEARKTGYKSVNFDLIYGLPLQTIEGIKQTISKVLQLMPDRIAFYSYAHVPWMKPGQRKYTEADLPLGDEKLALYNTGRQLLEEAGYKEIGMDHFALSSDSLFLAMKGGKLHRNFMGYTTTDTKLLIGLGASSISDAWQGFIQNIKVVEEYIKVVDQGRFPFFKGHILSPEDMKIRKHILNIMCNYKTSWFNDDEQCEAVYDAIERLQEMQNDGLVNISPFHLKVTEKGKPFVRNVCMAFDNKLWQQRPETQLFSQTV